jgi:hypothetical protein
VVLPPTEIPVPHAAECHLHVVASRAMFNPSNCTKPMPFPGNVLFFLRCVGEADRASCERAGRC